ncbi:hypothetical protein [Nocardia sp. NPDC046763]|uniref:hypothetical protein n=1 Tax=Nocardia sp. NPDC046763 TaxID=3155256 RepID=UPI0033CA3F0C
MPFDPGPRLGLGLAPDDGHLDARPHGAPGRGGQRPAYNDEELDPGFRTLAVPIQTPGAPCRFTLGLRGTTALMIPERLPFLVDLAKITAADIAARFAAAAD